MARPRTPTKIAELRGAYRKNPSRRPLGEPEPAGVIGPAPSHFSQEQSAIWDEVVGLCYPGVLGQADRIALEIICRLLHLTRTDFDNMTGAQLARLTGLLGCFGMTPADRAKINVPRAKPKNPYEGM